MTAKEALALPLEEPKVVGEVFLCFCEEDDDTQPVLFTCPRSTSGILIDDLCKAGHCCHLEFPEMASHVTSLLRDEVAAPVKVGSQMKLSLPNRCVPPNREGRYTTTTFRAKRSYHGKPWYDTIRYRFESVSVDGSGESVEGIGYGRCVCFYEDGDGNVGVILRCYNPFCSAASLGGASSRRSALAPELFDYDAQLAPLHLMNLSDRYSYMRINIDCILNGGFVLADPIAENKHWVVQGHREKCIYLSRNGG